MSKNQTATPLYELAATYLRKVAGGVKISKDFCREEIATHPDYPSLLSLMDFLNANGQENFIAVEATADNFGEMRYPALAHIKEPGHQYLRIIQNQSNWIENGEVIKNWSGVAIFPEQNVQWQHPENTQRVKEAQRTNLITAGWALIMITLFAFAVPYHSIAQNVLGLLALTGSFISIMVWSAELGYQTEIVKQVCGLSPGGGCEAVLKSKMAKGIAGITPADASLIYFAAQTILYFLSGFGSSSPLLPPWGETKGAWVGGEFSSSPLLGRGVGGEVIALALAGILVAAASLYTQAVVLKKWCPLCLSIVAVLVLQFAVALWEVTTLSTSSFYASVRVSRNEFLVPIFTTAAIFAIGLLIIWPLKTLLRKNRLWKQEALQLKKWKADPKLFLAQLHAEPKVDTNVWDDDLLLGNPDAPITITVACNPYFAPCARAHKELDELLEKRPNDINVLLRFVANYNNEQDSRALAVKHILQAVHEQPEKEKQAIINDWFEQMDLEKWNKKYAVSINGTAPNLPLQQAWAAQADIEFTPTFFVNGHKLPGRYSLENFKQLLPALAEQ